MARRIIPILIIIIIASVFIWSQRSYTTTDQTNTNPTPNNQQVQTPTSTTMSSAVTYYKDYNVEIETPANNAKATSPITIKGKARGTWFFEASLPVTVKDANGKVLGNTAAQAKGEWMTTDFVPFEVTITFNKPTTATGTVEIAKDNPSGLPQNDAHISFPITFN